MQAHALASPPPNTRHRMITQRSGEALGGLALTAFRVFVHPVIFSQLSAAFRSVLRHLGARWVCAVLTAA